jgi:hypothetical protein
MNKFRFIFKKIATSDTMTKVMFGNSFLIVILFILSFLIRFDILVWLLALNAVQLLLLMLSFRNLIKKIEQFRDNE